MKPELLKILERVRMSRHVPAVAPGAGTPETASERHVPDVPAVPAENGQGGNLHRRHLDATQRAVVADKLATLRHGDVASQRDAQTCASSPAPIMTQEAAAEALNVSRRSVQKVRAIREKAPDLIPAMEAGELTAHAAEVEFPVGALPPLTDPRAAALTRPSAIPAGTSGTAGTPHNSAVSSVPAADPGAGTSRDTTEPGPRFRAWRARFADGRTMTVLNPAGMDRAEALAAVDRWPGCTVEPLLASACTIPTTAISRL